MTRDEQLIRAALEMAARLAFWPAEKLKASLGSNFHTACSEASEAIRTIDPAEVLAKVPAPATDAVARLVKAARERDGGAHDPDCRINRRSNPFCDCGHDDLMSALAAMEGAPSHPTAGAPNE